MAFETPQWVWNVYTDGYSQEADLKVLRYGLKAESYYECISITSTTRVGLDGDVTNIFDRLLFKFREYFVLVAVEQFFAANYTFALIQGSVRGDLNWAPRQATEFK